MIIYKTTNKIDGKIYVGKLVDESKTSYIGSGMVLKNAIEKYGRKNFIRETLEENIDNHDYLCEREIHWIAKLDATNPEIGYNLCAGGKGKRGWKTSDETKKKISDSQSGEKSCNYGKRGEETSAYGKHHTNITKERIRSSQGDRSGKNSPRFGTFHTTETKERMSLEKLGIKNPSITKKEKVEQILSFLEKGHSIYKVSNMSSVGWETVKRAKNGFYDEMYEL